MYCVKCGKYLANDDRFCPSCGKTNPDFLYCMKCGKPLDSNDRFCSGCGAQNPNFDFDPYTPGINPPPSDYNYETGYTADDPRNAGHPGYTGDTGYSAEQNGAQTVSPYMQPQNYQADIPQAYTPESANAVGFVNSGTPAKTEAGNKNNNNSKNRNKNNNNRNGKNNNPGNRNNNRNNNNQSNNQSNRNNNINTNKNNNNKRNNKKDNLKIVAGLGIIFAVATGIIVFSNALAGQLGLNHEPSPRDLNNRGDYVAKEYTFNPMNNLKEPEVIWETDNVKISTMNIIHESSFSSSAKLQLQIENKTAQDIRVGSDNILINGYDTNDYLSQSVSAGSTTTGSVYIHLDTLEKLNIENINTIDIWFDVEDDSWDTIETSDKITIETRNTADNEPYVPDVILYEEDGFVIGYHGMEYYDQYSNDINFEFYYENNTDNPVCFKTSSFEINGESVKGYDDRPILYPGTGGIFKTRVKDEELKKIHADYIEKIDRIVVSVDGGTDKYSFKEPVFTTDPLVVTTH